MRTTAFGKQDSIPATLPFTPEYKYAMMNVLRSAFQKSKKYDIQEGIT